MRGALEDNDYGLSIQGGAQDNNDHSYLDRLVAKYQPVPTPSVIQGTITPNSGTNEAPVTVSSPSQGQEQTYGTILGY
jgi:hypothetical protein